MKYVVTIVLAFLMVAQCSAVASGEETVELSIRKEGEAAISRGLLWIMTQQMEDGSWSSYPAITALVVSAMLRSPFDYDQYNTEAISKGLDYITGSVKPDGSIHAGNMPGYNTSVCIMALRDARDPAYDTIIGNARDFLIRLQCDEEEGYQPDSVYYGGIGYGGDDRPDMSNMQWAMEALEASKEYAKRSEHSMDESEGTEPETELPTSGHSQKGIFWDKAVIFLERCQNFETNDQSWAGNDGGFVYYPGSSKAGGTTSYGSMTYAGLKSFIHANLDKEDPRVIAAYDWIRKNYTVDKNPEMGLQGLYYYYHTMAKALNIYGEENIEDDEGVKHNWREDLIIKLSSLQHEEGYWVNTNGRWWENNKSLVTAYCILALEEVLGTAR
ncbi:MAG: terpene cyclase/mutase family protein [bacterium]|nr:MAG: terpene cyclase/mutase family protein [bacterium]